jgi:hypothetical protein
MVDDANKQLLEEIRQFLKETGMGPSYFGKAAAGNSEVVARLKAGKSVTLSTANKVRAFMQARRANREAAE